MVFNPDEMILCVSNEIVTAYPVDELFHADCREHLISTMIAGSAFLKRGDVEEDRGWRQLIPYVVCRHAGKILLLERLNTQGESRLHNLLSIGAGGHINPEDASGEARDIIENAMWREMHEELDFSEVPSVEFKGIINFHGDPVAQVHLGFVYVADFGIEPAIRETDKMKGTFIWPDKLREFYDQMEGWSKVVVDSIEF